MGLRKGVNASYVYVGARGEERVYKVGYEAGGSVEWCPWRDDVGIAARGGRGRIPQRRYSADVCNTR